MQLNTLQDTLRPFFTSSYVGENTTKLLHHVIHLRMGRASYDLLW